MVELAAFDAACLFPDPRMKHTRMQVQPTTPADLHAIRAAYDAGRKTQREQHSMDTWASNDTLIEYYGRLGFQVVGRRRIAPDPRLAAHYHGIVLALLEKPCPSGVRVD